MPDDRFVFSEPEEERFIPWDEVIKGDKGEKGDPGPQGPKGDPGNYTKPDTGIPKTDLANDVQTSLGKADEAYVKPDTGIPKTDLASDVQTSLGKADTALQAGALPAGGTDGDVLVKNGATDYAGTWKKTPPQMGSLAYIEQTSSVSKQNGYQPGEYLVYNGQLYKVTASTISQGQTLNPGQGGNIEAASLADDVKGIVSSGYTNGCRWCKFADGTMIEWTNASISSVAITTAWGALFECSTAQSFGDWGVPFAIKPSVTILNNNGTPVNIESVLNMSETYIGNAYLWSAKSDTYSPSFSIIGIGRWKN